MSTNDIDPRDENAPDTAFDRLRASDPAASAEPDTTVIRAKVEATDAGASATAPVVDLAAQRRTRRPARWLQVAAAAAGVVAVGGGAFFAGQQSADAPISAESAVARDTAGSAPADASALGGATTEFSAGAQPGARIASGAADSTAMTMGGSFYGRTVFTSSGLSDATSSAQAWGYDPTTTFTAEMAARLAAALGVTGDPALNYGSWHVGSLDWTTPALDLSSDGQTTFSYSDPTIQPWAEGSTATGAPAEDAIAALTAIMTELGLDPAAYTITTDDQDPSATSVIAAPTQAVDGNGSWYASVTTDGVMNLSGALAPRVDLGTYDVVSPQTAVDRLSDERFGAGQGIAYAAGDVGVARGMDIMPALPDDPAAVPTLPAAPVAGATIAWPVTTVTITDATLGTATYVQPDGSVVLLPTYTLTGSDGGVWTVLAVADAHLDFAATS